MGNGLGVRIQGFTESESQFGEWPHMCAILHEKPIEPEGGYAGEPQTVNLYQCGGSLIAPGVILTAAHCVDKFRQTPTELKIRCGEWDTQNQTEPYPHQDRYVQALNIHPEFDGRNLHNDFAVLFTSEDFVLSSHIDTVCLPQAEELFDGTTCFATGWGKDKFGSLDAGSLDTIAEIFGTSGKQVDGGYDSGQQTGALSDDVDVLVQVIQESNNEYPNDYVPESAQQVVDKATVEVNPDFENCADYTESLGYECVPYYQCHNGTIITDGAGLIDIRNGFGSLTPEDSKCPGFLDVCCKDPDFIPPPPPKIKYAPKCGRRNQNGLGVRIQGFTESESQFGEWPHMCAILHEKPLEQDE